MIGQKASVTSWNCYFYKGRTVNPDKDILGGGSLSETAKQVTSYSP